MVKRLGFIAISLLILLAISVNLIGCSIEAHAADLMIGITPNTVVSSTDLSDGNTGATDFALRLLKASNSSGTNVLLSPLSVLCALAMTANGADFETRSQMESVMGMSTEELNVYLYTYLNSLPQGEKYKLSVANSIWFRDDDRFVVNQSFLQTNADYYGAQLYKSGFDNHTLKAINDWVKNQTDGMIPKIIDSVSEDDIMYLINALAFEAEWREIYEEKQVRDGFFTTESGAEQSVEFMYSTETNYLEDDNATGFIKHYSGGKYAFVALLPNESVTVEEYLSELEGDSLADLFANAECKTVKTAIPKFENEYKIELAETLKAMGMDKAFDRNRAEFYGIGEWSEGNIYVGDVLHKTYIQVGENGTRAGAATAVQIKGVGSAGPTEIKEVYLDRPFVYMLIDCENNVPFFIGTLMNFDR